MKNNINYLSFDELQKIHSEINQKEDDIKNIINEKDNIIKELNNKLLEHEKIINENTKEITNLYKKIDEITHKFNNQLFDVNTKINDINDNIKIKVKEEEEKINEKNNKYIKKVQYTKEIISSIIDYLNDKVSKDKLNLNPLLKEFKLKYYQNTKFQRFSIPVIGCISTGKSSILNNLLGLNDTLEIGNSISTKCVCIIRHKKGIKKKPKIYEVKIKKLENNIYHFIKGNEILDNPAKVISERNKLISDNKVGNDLEKYCLIIEYEIPLFKGEFEKYSNFFEFIDFPGFCELYNIYLKQILSLIQMNIKFSLFIFSSERYLEHSTIMTIESFIKSYFKDENKEDENNYNIAESFKESLFILNKMDLIEPKKRKEVEEEFKKCIEEQFKNKIYIKLNEENEIAISAKELNKNNSFEKYLNFYNNEIYTSYDDDNYYEYIIKNMNRDFKLNINNYE